MQVDVHVKAWAQASLAVLCAIGNTGKQPKQPPSGEWTDMFWYAHAMKCHLESRGTNDCHLQQRGCVSGWLSSVKGVTWKKGTLHDSTVNLQCPIMVESKLVVSWEPENMRKKVRETQGNLGKVMDLFSIFIPRFHPYCLQQEGLGHR